MDYVNTICDEACLYLHTKKKEPFDSQMHWDDIVEDVEDFFNLKELCSTRFDHALEGVAKFFILAVGDGMCSVHYPDPFNAHLIDIAEYAKVKDLDVYEASSVLQYDAKTVFENGSVLPLFDRGFDTILSSVASLTYATKNMVRH